jgi:hypothetical protein
MQALPLRRTPPKRRGILLLPSFDGTAGDWRCASPSVGFTSSATVISSSNNWYVRCLHQRKLACKRFLETSGLVPETGWGLDDQGATLNHFIRCHQKPQALPLPERPPEERRLGRRPLCK